MSELLDCLDPRTRIMTLAAAVKWRESLRRENRTLVVTNGCFDLLHRGHAEYLAEARSCGDALLILLNSDASTRMLKGPHRPIIDEFNRAYLVASLRSVDAVVTFPNAICAPELAALQPDVYVKGGDYNFDDLNPEEREALLAAGARFIFKPFVDGFSTTSLIEKIGHCR